MLVQIAEKQAEMEARREYQENVSKISDLDDICRNIDELIERYEASDCDFKNKFIQSLKDMKFDVMAEEDYYEDENLEIMEVWEGM